MMLPFFVNSLRNQPYMILQNVVARYIYDHRNASFAEWFVSLDGPIINNRTLLEPKILINPLVLLRGGSRALSIPECLIVLHRFYGFSVSGFARCQEVGGSGVSLLI